MWKRKVIRFDNVGYDMIIKYEKKKLKYDKKYYITCKITRILYKYTNMSKLYDKRKYISKFI